MKSIKKKYYMSQDDKKKIISLLTEILKTFAEIDFAYLHGSFLNREEFGDIDIAVFIRIEEYLPEVSLTKLEIDLEVKVEKIAGYPVDIRALNNAPLSFRYNVLKNGQLMFARDEDFQVDFAARTITSYIEFSPYRKRYLKEVLGLEV